jgi:23S rRNA (uracil1939-C5)-methyltransferase
MRLKIDSLSYGPYGIGRDNRRVVLVPLTAPGDEVEVRIVEERKNYGVGQLLLLVKPSPLRRVPPCPYFGRCGGCAWQHVQYEGQLVAKEKTVADTLRRIGKLDGFELLSILRPAQEYGYRRRIRLQCDGTGRLGFHRALSHELIEIDSCLIADPRLERCLSQAKGWLKRLKTDIGDIEIVAGDRHKELVLAARMKGRFFSEDDAACRDFLRSQDEFIGLILSGPGWHRTWGQEKISVRLEEALTMQVDADLFTQVNREGNSQILGELLRWGEFDRRDRVLELYAGAGNLTLPVARRVGEVVAVERNSRSVENGKTNGQLNRIQNIRWSSSDVCRQVENLARKRERFSKIILNPPSSGAKGIEGDLASMAAERILYLSCNPATLARDLSALSHRGYRLTRVRPIDLFPQTFHVETLAEMVLE